MDHDPHPMERERLRVALSQLLEAFVERDASAEDLNTWAGIVERFGDRVRDAPPLMGAEDFSFMLNARPGAFIFVGNGDTANVHHPQYDFNDELIPVGCSYWARLVETAMPAG